MVRKQKRMRRLVSKGHLYTRRECDDNKETFVGIVAGIFILAFCIYSAVI